MANTTLTFHLGALCTLRIQTNVEVGRLNKSSSYLSSPYYYIHFILLHFKIIIIIIILLRFSYVIISYDGLFISIIIDNKIAGSSVIVDHPLTMLVVITPPTTNPSLRSSFFLK